MLRRETMTEHHVLDGHVAFAALQNGSLGVDGYRRLMRALHGFHHSVDLPVRRAWEAHSIQRSGFEYVSRSEILADDLASLGVDQDGWMADPPGVLGPIDCAAALGGIIYVFEGSMLGGSVMCDATETLLADAGSRGNDYWRWCRDVGPQRWPAACRLLDELADTDEAQEAMVGSARAVFHRMAEWLMRWDDDPAN